MKIYVASSWRNHQQPFVVEHLRLAGYDVYDPPGDKGFGWRQITDDEAAFVRPERFRDEVLTHPVAQAAFAKDMNALKAADVTVLVLPCGLELGYATGAGQKTIVLLDDPMSEPELMYLMNTKICTTMSQVLDELRRWA